MLISCVYMFHCIHMGLLNTALHIVGSCLIPRLSLGLVHTGAYEPDEVNSVKCMNIHAQARHDT